MEGAGSSGVGAAESAGREAQPAPVEGPAPASEPAGAAASLPHESGAKHVTGRALYVDDQVAARGLLATWLCTSPHAHARILRRDARAARAMPGIHAVLFADDIPGENDVGPVRHDEPLLAREVALFHGQAVALVVGDDEEVCRAAASRVEVDYEPLPPILGIEEAVAAGAFLTEPHRIREGEVDEALAGAARRLSGELACGGQEHFYLEGQAAWAEPTEDGGAFVSSSTQHPSEVQAAVARVLGVARNQVVVESPRMGGGFGGKETQGAAWAALAALGARATGRAVRVRPHRDLDMRLTGKRHPMLARFEVGFEPDGRVRALRVALYSNGGWSLDLSESIMDRALFHLDNAYRIPAMEVEGRVCRTNLPSNTAFRGFGGPQGVLVIEEVLARVACALGLDPAEVRRRNLYQTGDHTHYGQRLEDVRTPRMWDRLAATASLAERREAIRRWNAASPHAKRGLAVTPVKFGISFTASFLNQAGALVLCYQDGSVQVSHGGTEMGQGLHTKMLGVAARELGVSPSRIRVMHTRTDKVPNTSATAASSGSDLNGQAVKAACETLRARLAEVACQVLAERSGGARPDPATIRFAGDRVCAEGREAEAIGFRDLCQRAYLEQVSLSATGFYATPGLRYDKRAGRGRPFHYFAYGVAASEVEVDGFTGAWTFRRADILHDVGSSLNEGIDRGQIEGGFIQGVGWLTMEDVIFGADGRLQTAGPSTYKIPAIGDAPRDFRVELLPDAAQANVIHGSKAVGEPPLMLAISAREALRDAVAAFASPAVHGEGQPVLLAAPATCEAILDAIDRLRGEVG